MTPSLDYFPNTQDLPVTAVIAARERIECHPHAKVRDLPDGGLEVVVSHRAGRKQQTQLVIGLIVVGTLGFIGALISWKLGLSAGVTFNGIPADLAFVLISLAVLGLALMTTLVVAIQGTPRDTVFHAHDGRVNADYAFVGDRATAELTPANCALLAIEDGGLVALTTIGTLRLLVVGPRALHQSIALLLASKLWSAYGVVITGDSRRKTGPWQVAAIPPRSVTDEV